MTNSNFGKGLFQLTLPHHCLFKDSRAETQGRVGTWRKKLQQRSWRSTASWLAPRGLLFCLFKYPRETYVGWTLPTVACALLRRSSVKKLPHRLSSKPVLWRPSFSWGALLSDDSSLCPVSKILAVTRVSAGWEAYATVPAFATWALKYISWFLGCVSLD